MSPHRSSVTTWLVSGLTALALFPAAAGAMPGRTHQLAPNAGPGPHMSHVAQPVASQPSDDSDVGTAALIGIALAGTAFAATAGAAGAKFRRVRPV